MSYEDGNPRNREQEDDDDEPILGAPRLCADCGKSGSYVPLSEWNGELVCGACEASRIDFGRKHCGETSDVNVEIFAVYHVRIGLRVRNLSHEELILAKLRAIEILFGIPVNDDRESWEHELIALEDENGTEIPED